MENFKRFLRLETEQLRLRHRSGHGGLQITSERTHQVDLVLNRMFGLAASETGTDLERIAVVATGGYGRSELAPFSEVDLLLLHDGSRGDSVRILVEEVIRLASEVGLALNHGFRSLRECMGLVREDFRARAALTESRFVTGKRDFFEAVQKDLDARLLWDRKLTEAFLESMRAEIAERHAKSAGAVAVQDPNVKEGLGGLRDLHTILWVGHARFGSRGLAALHSEGCLSASEHYTARRSLDFLSRVRNELHFLAGKKNDVLGLDLQEEAAANLGYGSVGDLLASEVFMRDYYRRASELADLCRGFMLRHLQNSSRGSHTGSRRHSFEGGFEVREGQLCRSVPESGGGVAPLMAAFAISQSEKLPLSDKLKHTIQGKLHLVGQKFRELPETTAAFLRLLHRRGRAGSVLRDMHETGFLGRLLPEWERITFLVQHDYIHRYTVDEHTLRAVEAIDSVATGEAQPSIPLGRILDDVPDVRPLYLGLLLHDIGKGQAGDHVEAATRISEQILGRWGLDRTVAEDVLFLVKMHLEMSRVSQQRDLSEPSLIASFAQRVGSLERLDMLLLMTYADLCAISPGIWNEWKGTQLFDLYRRTRAHLAASTVEEGTRDASRAHAVEALKGEFPPAEVERHFSMLSERYLRAHDAERMVQHFRLMAARGDAPVALDWQDLEDGNLTEMTVTADDGPGFFAKVAGTLTANGINILAVDLFAREDGVVLDTFKLSESHGHRPVDVTKRAKVASEIAEAVAGKACVDEAVQCWLSQNPQKARRPRGRAAGSPSVRLDNEASTSTTVIDVRVQDRPGLAFTIADTLARLGLNISVAKVATDGALALDVFYVTELGHKLAPERLPVVERALLDVLRTEPTPGRESARRPAVLSPKPPRAAERSH